ncbi:MAG: hypothetical protein NTV88_04215, partial [Candidatus Micrarchaeota archaeon]|nr:hypothetical protein [Candidatus Micrarchaeota archaeon]
ALSQQSAKAKYAAVGAMEIDRASDVQSNIQDQLYRILSAQSQISVNGNIAVFDETLPYDPEFAIGVERFKEFETNFSDLNVSMDLTNLKNADFMVQPNNVRVSHAASNFFVTPQNSSASSGAVSSYDVRVVYSAGSLNGATWQSLASVANGSANSTLVHVIVQDASYSFLQEYYYTLNKSKTSYLNLTQGGVQVGFVQFSAPSALQVSYTGNIGLKTSIGLTNPVHVETNDTITVVASANKTSYLRIA